MSNILIEKEKPHHSNSKENKSNRSKTHTPPKIDYKGITVKEYFRLCDQIEQSNLMEEIQQQSLRSSQQSNAKTPAFGGFPKNQNYARKLKMKTQVEQQDQMQISYYKKPSKKSTGVGYPILGQKLSSTMDQKGLLLPSYQNTKKVINQKSENKKRMVSIPSKKHKDFLNQSTLSSFYKLEKKKKTMLDKLKKEKQKINQMRLSDAFFITKYSSKFKLNHDELK